MTLRLAFPTPTYDPAEQSRIRAEIERADAQNFKRLQDVRLQNGERLILKSPNGSVWSITVSNAGAISAVATT
jgi:hypothetical protein